MDDKTNLRSIEQLSHFRCLFCDQWWSVGDASLAKREWYCPWCGHKQEFSTSSDNENTKK